MKRFLALSSLLLVAFAMAADKASIAAVAKDPAKFDGKVIAVVGKVSHFKAKTSKAGNKYFVFDIEEGKAKLAIYGQGELAKAPKDGDKVEATGKFVKEKDMKSFTIHNEIDVTAKESDSKNGVKILK